MVIEIWVDVSFLSLFGSVVLIHLFFFGKKSAFTWSVSSQQVSYTSSFLLCLFPMIFSFSLVFTSLTIVCFDNSLSLYCLGFLRSLNLYISSFAKFCKFQLCYSLCPFLSSPSRTSVIEMLDLLFPRVPEALFIFFLSLLSVCVPDCIISTILVSRLLILSSVSSIYY